MESQENFAFVASRLASFSGKKSWPHKSPTPTELAQAGFYYKPSSQSNDNTICFVCDRALDGWEQDDDPIQEHLKHSPNCGWAILANISQIIHHPSSMEDPTQPTLTDARRATFRSGWPHETKRGWTCKTERMVEAGWHFAPTVESEDFVTCAYCKLSLDGWEPKDNPFDEHYKRSAECPFFTFAGTSAPKTGRGKKSRTSKATRLSTQASTGQTQSIPDLDDSIDTSNISITSTASVMGSKKSTRGKKTAQVTEHAPIVAIEQPSILVEEPAYSQKSKATRGKKRTSEQISEDDHRERESTVRPEPQAKRRNTRSRTSVVRDLEESVLVSAVDMMDVDVKPAKGGRKRASSTSRKVSIASTGALRAGAQASIPDDATIEAALEADLDKPLSDEEHIPVNDSEKPKRARSKKATASKAPLRKAKSNTEERSDAHDDENAAQDGQTQADSYETDLESKQTVRKPRIPKKATVEKTSKKIRLSTSSCATAEIQVELPVESSVIASHTAEDDSGHETDASAAGKGVARKGSKRKATVKGRSKKTGARVVSRTIQRQPEASNGSPMIAAPAAVSRPKVSLAAAMTAENVDVDEEIAQLTKEIEEEDAPQKKTRGVKDGKGKSSKAKPSKKDKIPQLSMPGAFSPLAFESAEPSFASALSPTSPPIKSNLDKLHETQKQADTEPEMEMRSPEEQTTPTPRRVAAPQIPERSSPRLTPTPTANKTRSGIPMLRSSPLRSAQRPAHTAATLSPTPERSPSAQSSDAENAPPSTRPESVRPPLAPISPIKRVQLLPDTPTTVRRLPMVPSKIGGGLTSSMPWSAVNVDLVFAITPATERENVGESTWTDVALTSPEKKMSVEEWISENARKAEDELRMEGERVVGVFEREGRRAMAVLEGIECV